MGCLAAKQATLADGDDQRHGGTQRTQKKVEDQTGDPRYLDQIHKCIASRRALLGLDAPAKIAPTSPDGEEAYHSHVMAELMKLAEQAKEGPEVIDGQAIDRLLLEGETANESEDDCVSQHKL